jgi:uncharacterized iron-regulated protein
METQTKINLMLGLEDKARALRNKMDKIETQWEDIRREIEDSLEWEKTCKSRGWTVNYSFGDMLA